MKTHPLDQLIARRTAFASMLELVTAAGGYRPSLDVADREMLRIAEAYDTVQTTRGDPRRAYRYGTPFVATVGNTPHGKLLANQALRIATVIGTAGDRALVSYDMPNAGSYLWDVPEDTPWQVLRTDPWKVARRTISSANPPARWRGCLQGTPDPAPDNPPSHAPSTEPGDPG